MNLDQLRSEVFKHAIEKHDFKKALFEFKPYCIKYGLNNVNAHLLDRQNTAPCPYLHDDDWDGNCERNNWCICGKHIHDCVLWTYREVADKYKCIRKEWLDGIKKRGKERDGMVLEILKIPGHPHVFITGKICAILDKTATDEIKKLKSLANKEFVIISKYLGEYFARKKIQNDFIKYIGELRIRIKLTCGICTRVFPMINVCICNNKIDFPSKYKGSTYHSICKNCRGFAEFIIEKYHNDWTISVCAKWKIFVQYASAFYHFDITCPELQL